MKTTGEMLARIKGLSHDDINNFRKLGLLHSERRAGKLLFTEREHLVLAGAFPERQRGMRPRAAFAASETAYAHTINTIRESVCEYMDLHQGRGPTVADLGHMVGNQISDLSSYILAMLEERQICESRGVLSLLSPFQSGEQLIAFSKQHKVAHNILTAGRRLQLRQMALRIYFAVTNEATIVPVPIEVLLDKEGFTIDFGILPRNHFGYLDRTNKKIILANECRRNVGKRRLALMHEYFHYVLGHGVFNCTWTEAAVQEAEATYAAVHFLVPSHTFESIVFEVTRGAGLNSSSALNSVAERYCVSREVIIRYVDEWQRLLPQRGGDV